MVFQNDILAGASGSIPTYSIDQSIRFNDDDSAYLRRTPSASSNRHTATLSVWVKWSPNKYMNILTPGTDGNNYGLFRLGDNGAYGYGLAFGDATGGSFNWLKRSKALFRDPSAWYHYVAVVDTTDATAADRAKVYINGTRITDFSPYNTNPSLNYNNNFNTISTPMDVGRDPYNGTYGDGYMAEYHWIDGQALTPTDFGETNDDGVWIPKAFTGTYGTNGFYITGEDSAALGTDYSGNGNDFTSSGLAAADQMLDTPTDNYFTFNNLACSTNITLSDGNLKATCNSNVQNNQCTGTAAASAGKISLEYTIGASNRWFVGATAETGYGPSHFTAGATGLSDTTAFYYSYDGSAKYGGSALAGSWATFTTNDVINIDIDLDSLTIDVRKNNVSTGSTVSIIAGAYTALISIWNSSSLYVNAGQTAFTYALPIGFTALSTANLPTPTITDGSANFQTTLYTGTGSTLEVNQSENSTFQPDLVWIKQRNKVDNHVLTDAVRVAPAAVYSNSTAAEVVGTGGVTSLDADGFTLGTWNNVNQSGITAAAWQWKANGAGSSNEDGSINTTATSVNTTAGISISTFEGNGTAGATIGHGLGVKPSWIVIKNRDGTEQWIVYHATQGATKYGLLNDVSGFASSSGAWNNTEPTSSLITLGGGGFGTNVSGNSMVCYSFAEIDGFSKLGSYTGNGSTDGTFVWCGFKPAWLVYKRTNDTSSWVTTDKDRLGYNPDNNFLYMDTTVAEMTTDVVDYLSNGFKLRTTLVNSNGSGSNYIFMAFAEHPFGGAGVAPATAR